MASRALTHKILLKWQAPNELWRLSFTKSSGTKSPFPHEGVIDFSHACRMAGKRLKLKSLRRVSLRCLVPRVLIKSVLSKVGRWDNSTHFVIWLLVEWSGHNIQWRLDHFCAHGMFLSIVLSGKCIHKLDIKHTVKCLMSNLCIHLPDNTILRNILRAPKRSPSNNCQEQPLKVTDRDYRFTVCHWDSQANRSDLGIIVLSTIFPWLLPALEQFPPLNSSRTSTRAEWNKPVLE